MFHNEVIIKTTELMGNITLEDAKNLRITSKTIVGSHYLALDICGTKKTKLVYAIREKNNYCVADRLDYVIDELESAKGKINKVSCGYTIMDYEAENPDKKIPSYILTKEEKENLLSARTSMNESLRTLTKIIVDILEEEQ